MKDDFGDRMKVYEMAEAGRRLMPLLPAFARIDGRSFHNFTRGLNRPFDERLSRMMIDTCIFLARETNACMGYAQSDEITLAWSADSYDSQVYFDGRIMKMCSSLASLTSVYFYRLCLERLPPEYADRLPTFDCRVWNVPNRVEGANVYLWREKDATKNSISMAARACYSHKELEGKSASEMQELLWQKSVNWNDYPGFFKRGTFVQSRVMARKFAVDELERLPEKHEARKNPDLVVEQTDYLALEMPPFAKVTNRVEVVFEGADPRMADAVSA